MNLIIRLVISAAALWVAAWAVPGIGFGEHGQEQLTTVLVVALIFGVINALIKPIIAFFTCPFYILTLGLFTFIVNALMLMLTSAIATSFGFSFFVGDFGDALLGAIVVSVVSWILSIFLGGDNRERED